MTAIVLAVVLAYAALWTVDPDAIFTFGTKTGVMTAPVSGYGFATDLSGLSKSQLNQQLDAMQATGVTWVRYDLSWAQVQPNSASQYNWAASDLVTKAARAHGFKVLMIVDFAPKWAQAHGCTLGELCAPASPIAYATFAGAAAKHYQPMGVDDWEIWNEPNIAFRFEPTANPALYVRMLKDSYAAIKRVEPHGVVITGGTSPSATDSKDYSPANFISDLYQDGAKGWFDAVGAHPYTYPITPDQSQSTDAWGQLTGVHDIMASYGDGNKQIWITEYGAPTNGPANSGDYVSEDAQATMATQATNDIQGMPWVGPFFWYSFMDVGTSTSTNQNFFGLVRADGSQKPAYAAFVNAVSGD